MATGDDDKALLDDWRQGDAALLPVQLPFLTLDDGEIAVGSIVAVHGVVLLSQSCDVIKPPSLKPRVQVAALEFVSSEDLERVSHGHVPSHVYLPSLAQHGLVVDLDKAATVDKEIVASWPRTPGCVTDDEQRDFASALARHRQRFAFPDAFNALVKPIRRWFEDKVGKNSPPGRLVAATREVRVLVDDWDAPTFIRFLVLVAGALPPEAVQWQKDLDALAERRKQAGYPDPEFRVASLDGLSAAEYLASDRLDWDGLSDA